MRKLLASIALGALLATGSAVAVPSTATAAPVQQTVVAKKAQAKVTVKKITTKTAPYGGKAKIKPRVTKSGPVKVKSKTLTVKKAGKTVAKNKKTVSLKPGTYTVTTKVKYQRYTVKSTANGSKKSWGPVKTKTKKQKLVVKQGKKPSRTTPASKWNCPSWAPVKGNGNSGIYHVPGGRYYDITSPEECFTTASAARNAGYRASKNG